MVSPYKGNSVKKLDLKMPEVNIEGLFDEYKKEDFSLKYQIDKTSNVNNEFNLDDFVKEAGLDLESPPTDKSNISDVKPVEAKEEKKAWWEKGLEILGTTACTVVNAAVSLVEGVVELGEGIVDAAVVVGAAVITAANPITWLDLGLLGASKLFNFEYESVTEKVWAEAVMPFVGFDVSGKTFDALYSSTLFSTVEEGAWGPFKRKNGSVYKIGKSVGTVAGTIGLAILTGGTSIPLTVSTSSAVIAGTQKMGNSIEKSYKGLSDAEKQDLGSLFAINANGAVKGVIEGAVWYATYGNGLGKIGNWFDGTKLGKWFGSTKLSTHFTKGKTWMQFLVDKKTIALELGKVKLTQQSLIKGGLQFSKTYANWFVDLLSIGSEENLGEVTREAIVNAGISIFYDNIFGKNLLNPGKKAIESTYKFNEPKTNELANELANSVDSVASSSTDQTFRKTLADMGGNAKLTHEGSIILEAYNKTGGTIIKKFETLVVDLFTDGISTYFKKIFGGA